MASPLRTPAHARPAAGQSGYVLLYVMAVLIALASLALTVAYRERLGMQLVINQVSGTQDEHTLQAAHSLLLAQLDLAQQLAAPANASDPVLGKLPRWGAGDEQEVAVGEQQVRITLEDRAAQPDFNLLDEKEYTRLLLELGIAPEAAAQYAGLIVAARPDTGFTDRSSFRDIAGLPPVLLQASESGSDSPGFYDLITLGSGGKWVDPETTPLPVVAALTGYTAEQLATLKRLRSDGKVDRKLWLDTFGGDSGRFLSPGTALLARLKLDGSPLYAEVQLLRRDSGWHSQALILLTETEDSRSNTTSPP
ncbi:hypothetical protein [Chitinimonas sp. JJ19]|uniref:hypothetical protein n=1 Tax=Chitinimonas sp. JJ19 TaxID=3109352 RepID=UPI003002D590